MRGKQHPSRLFLGMIMRRTAFVVGLVTLALAWGWSASPKAQESPTASNRPDASSQQEPDRSPVDLALSPDGAWLVTANETSSSVSLVSVGDQKVLDEIAVGHHPAFIALCPDGQTVLVSCAHSGEVTVLNVASNRLKVLGSIPVGFEPCG